MDPDLAVIAPDFVSGKRNLIDKRLHLCSFPEVIVGSGSLNAVRANQEIFQRI